MENYKVDFILRNDVKYTKEECWDTFYGPYPKRVKNNSYQRSRGDDEWREIPPPINMYLRHSEGGYYDDDDEWVCDDYSQGEHIGKYIPSVQGEIYDGNFSENGLLNYGELENIDRSDFAKYRFGFECEKEDSLCSDDLADYLEYGYSPESDCSLSDGFELVSPMYDLMSDDLDNVIKKSLNIRRDINAEYSKNCGGHMSISHAHLSGGEFYSKIETWMPLLMALYPKRLKNHYCSPISNSSCKSARGERRAINVSNNRIEFRIFPAIKNVDNLLWRRDLLRIMIKNQGMSYIDIHKAMNDVTSELGSLLSKVYSDSKRMGKAEMYLGIAYLFLDDVKVQRKYVERVAENHAHIVNYFFDENSAKRVEYSSKVQHEEILAG